MRTVSSSSAPVFATPRDASLALSKLAHARKTNPQAPMSMNDANLVSTALLAGGQVGQGIKGSGVSVWTCLFATDPYRSARGCFRGADGLTHPLLPFLLETFDDIERPALATRVFVEFFHRSSALFERHGNPFGMLLDAGARPLPGLMEMVRSGRYASRQSVESFLYNLVTGKDASVNLHEVFDGTGLGPEGLETARWFLEKLGRNKSDALGKTCQDLLTNLMRDAMAANIPQVTDPTPRKALRL